MVLAQNLRTLTRVGIHTKKVARAGLIWLYQAVFEPAAEVEEVLRREIGSVGSRTAKFMKRSRMHIFYSGHVQGVGFRYTVKSVATGFEMTGTVRNLLDGRVELLAEGHREELEAFQNAIRDAGLGALIRHEDVSWTEATGEFRGFEIVR